MYDLTKVEFVGEDEIPKIRIQSLNFKKPFQMVRFSDRKVASLNDTICFYEWDKKFVNQLKDEKILKLIPTFMLAGSVVQPDYSIYADEPLILQKMAVYEKNRVAIILQSFGIEIIPNLRWSDERSYDFAFASIPKGQVCAIGTYGQIKDKEKRYLFEKGLEVALEKVRPKEVLIYGSMPHNIFGPYEKKVKFTRYPSWKEQKAGEAV